MRNTDSKSKPIMWQWHNTQKLIPADSLSATDQWTGFPLVHIALLLGFRLTADWELSVSLRTRKLKAQRSRENCCGGGHEGRRVSDPSDVLEWLRAVWTHSSLTGGGESQLQERLRQRKRTLPSVAELTWHSLQSNTTLRGYSKNVNYHSFLSHNFVDLIDFHLRWTVWRWFSRGL